jgi:CRP-like cAMP-binding protein
MSETIKGSDINEFAGYVYKFLLQYVKLSETDFNQFLPFLEVRRYAKREEVLKYGQTDEYLNLVVKGLLRKYVLVGKNEKSLQLATEGQIIQSEVSFHTRVPSTVIIEAMEPSILVSMRHDNVEYVLDNIPAAEQLGRQMMTYLFIKKDAKYYAQLNTTTRERFLHYLTNHPHMLQRVHQKILASYLEIKPETFSRLKHLLKS